MHLSDVKEPLNEGDLVEFSVLDFKGRPKAQDVVRISGPAKVERVQGRCLWYDATRKMGFLKGSDGQEIFCHASDVKDSIGEELCGNQPVRRVKSFLGDDAAVLARSSGKESASPRHRAGIASMAWSTTR